MISKNIVVEILFDFRTAALHTKRKRISLDKLRHSKYFLSCARAVPQKWVVGLIISKWVEYVYRAFNMTNVNVTFALNLR